MRKLRCDPALTPLSIKAGFQARINMIQAACSIYSEENRIHTGLTENRFLEISVELRGYQKGSQPLRVIEDEMHQLMETLNKVQQPKTAAHSWVERP